MFLDYILCSIIIIPSRNCNIHFPSLRCIPKLQGKIVQWNATVYWSAQTKSWRRAYRLGNVYSINCLKLTWTRRNWEASVSRRAPRLIEISLIEITEEWILVNLENLPISWLMYMLLTENEHVGGGGVFTFESWVCLTGFRGWYFFLALATIALSF